MSGRWEPYVISVFDKFILHKIWENNPELYNKWELAEQDLNVKWGVKLSKNPAIESDMKQVGVMLGSNVSDYRDDPNYLKELREIYVNYYIELTGNRPTPFIPVGPREMFQRNQCNMEYSSTALYYCPGPDDDLIMCVATDFEFTEGYSKSQHFRIKSTGEYIGNDEEVKSSPYRIIRFAFDKNEQKAVRLLVISERQERHKKHLKKLMTELREECRTKKCYDFQRNIPGEIDQFAKKVSSACYYFERINE